MKPDLDELERFAKAATPGPWRRAKYHDTNDCDYFAVVDSRGDPLHTTNGVDDTNAAFMAAANPIAILALIADLRAKDRRLDAAVTLLGDLKMELILDYAAEMATAAGGPTIAKHASELRDRRAAFLSPKETKDANG